MIIILLPLYFLPTILALTRGKYRHGRPGKVFLLNCIPLLGWFIAMIYVATGEKLTERQHREVLEAIKASKS
ncbi:hypothetical protein SAMN02990966_03952 [Rhodospirillales bacterium URHD0017]|nr:hypothetical protein SAMN02990966_03952 [Rhodospirillales bacterium URHD0017]